MNLFLSQQGVWDTKTCWKLTIIKRLREIAGSTSLANTGFVFRYNLDLFIYLFT